MLKHFNDSRAMSPGFIFSEPVHFSYGGSFVIRAAEDNAITTESIEQQIAVVCEKNFRKESCSIYTKTVDDTAAQKFPVFVIKCSKQGYEISPIKHLAKLNGSPNRNR